MKITRKKAMGTLLITLAVAMLCAVSACVGKKAAVENAAPDENGVTSAPEAEISSQGGEQSASFLSFSGTIKEVNAFYESESQTERAGWYFVSAEDENGLEGTIVVTDKTFYATGTKLAEGEPITCFYDANAPAPAIYPPQYNALVVVIGQTEIQTVKLDCFDDNLLSSDSMLKLNIADTTKIISQDGKSFDGELADRKLVVYYSVTTRSIPAQTTPEKIVVLNEEK